MNQEGMQPAPISNDRRQKGRPNWTMPKAPPPVEGQTYFDFNTTEEKKGAEDN